MNAELTEAQREKRRKKNAKRKFSRQRYAANQALPPIMGLSRAQFEALVGGTQADYDAYADNFIKGVKAKGRRYEFPLEPVGGVCFPSRVRHHKGMTSGAQ
jgi:hypothetical protein